MNRSALLNADALVFAESRQTRPHTFGGLQPDSRVACPVCCRLLTAEEWFEDCDPAPSCDQCGRRSRFLALVEGRDDTVGYVETLHLCPACRREPEPDVEERA